MKRYISKTVTAATVSESLAEIITGGSSFRRTLVGVMFETIPNVHFRVYIETDRIFDVSGDIDSDSAQPLMIDRPILDGETVRAGWFNGTGSSVTHDFTVIIEEETVGSSI